MMKNPIYKAKTLAVINFLILTSFNSHAQEENPNQFTIGLQMQQVQTDLGFGVHLLSPKFLGNFRVKSSYNMNFFTHLNTIGESTWTPYSNIYFGTRYQFAIIKNINTYVEAGSQMLINPSSLTSERINAGGYGLVGVEYFISESAKRHISFFMELGGAVNNSKADKIITKPRIANGFTLAVGFQFNINLKK